MTEQLTVLQARLNKQRTQVESLKKILDGLLRQLEEQQSTIDSFKTTPQDPAPTQ